MKSNQHQSACQPWTKRRVKVTTPQLRVLVVDDNVNAGEALLAYLQSEDMDCQVAFGGREAIEVGTDWRPHVIVMDISMPKCNGFQAAMALRCDERTRAVAIIAFTALDEGEVRRHLVDEEFDGYCQKGHGPTGLVELITHLAH
jgi:CheY-like chemotaxis protein